MNTNDAVIEFLLNQLRQQLTNNPIDVMAEVKRWSIDRSIAGRGNYTDEENTIIDAYIGLEQNPYKQQCEDLAHEVLSLKNQLRDASKQIKELHLALVKATGDAEAYKLIRKGGRTSEQSGCRKEDTQESCWIEWSGGACPVPSGTLVDVIYRDGETLYGLPADELNDTERDASVCFWQHDGASNDIVRYRKAVLQ